MSDTPWSLEVGKQYMIETVTFYFTGRVKAVTPTDIVLDECAKIFDTGRLHQCVERSRPEESEFIGDGVVLRMATMIAAIPWSGKLPHTI